MTGVLRLRDYRTWITVFLLALLIAWIVGEQQGLLGMLIGLVGAMFGVTGLFLLVRLIGRAVTRGISPSAGTLLTVLAFIAKIPVYVVLGGVAYRIGGTAPAAFVAGIGLVYFALVAWASSR